MTCLFALAAPWRLELREHLRNLGRCAVLDRLLIELYQLCHCSAQADTAVAECGEQIVLALHIELFRDLGKSSVRHELLCRIAEPLCLVADEGHAALDVRLTVLPFEPCAYLAARRRGGNGVQPVGAWPAARLVRNDGDDVAVLQLVFKRHDLSIDLCTDAVMPDLRVDVIGKVDGVRAFRQVDDIAARRKDKDLVGEYVELQCLEEFLRIIVFLLEADHLTQPRHLLIILIARADAPPCFLVFPVSRDTELGDLVHRLGADLDLERIPLRHDGRMQGLIAVGLRHGNIVLEPSRDRLPHRVDDAEHAIAVLNRRDEDTHG